MPAGITSPFLFTPLIQPSPAVPSTRREAKEGFEGFRRMELKKVGMIPIVSIVGKSGSGKTTLIEKLIPELVRRGYKIATVKHDVHGFEVDREGKDSWRHKKAGAHTVVISSPLKLALIRDVDHDADLTELRDRYIADVDLILSEGFKKNKYPKIEVFRPEMHRDLLCTKEDDLVAIATNRPLPLDVPCFDLNDAPGLVDLIEQRFLKKFPPRLKGI